MKKIRVPAGTVQKFENVFSDVQDAVKTNSDKLLDIDYSKKGFLIDVVNGIPVDNDWKLTVKDSDSVIVTINTASNKAMALTGNKEILSLSASVDLDIGSPNEAVPYYVVYVDHGLEYNTPATIVDGFVYDAEGAVSTINTVQVDKTQIKVTNYSSFSSAYNAASNHDAHRLPLGIFYVSGSPATIKTKADWISEGTSDTNYNSIYHQDDGVYDLRFISSLKADYRYLPDNKILYKDRNSTSSDGGPILGEITISKKLHSLDHVTIHKNLGIGLGEADTPSTRLWVEDSSSTTPIATLYNTNSSSDGLATLSFRPSSSSYYIWDISQSNSGNKLILSYTDQNSNVKTTALTLQNDKILASKELQISQGLMVSGRSIFSEDVILGKNKTLAIGSHGISSPSTDVGSDSIDLYIKRSSLGAKILIEQTSSGYASKIVMKNTANEYGIFSNSDPNRLTIGRVTGTGIEADLYLDSTGAVHIGNDLVVDQDADITVTGFLKVNDNFITEPTNKRTIIGDGIPQNTAELSSADLLIYKLDSSNKSTFHVQADNDDTTTTGLQIIADSAKNTITLKPDENDIFYISDKNGVSSANLPALKIDLSNKEVTLYELKVGARESSSDIYNNVVSIENQQVLNFEGATVGTKLGSVDTSGHIFAIGNNVTFLNGNLYNPSNTTYSETAILFDTSDTSNSIGGKIKVYATKPGTSSLNDSSKALEISNNTNTGLSTSAYNKFFVSSIDGDSFNYISDGSSDSTINKLTGATLTYDNANLTNITSTSITGENIDISGLIVTSGTNKMQWNVPVVLKDSTSNSPFFDILGTNNVGVRFNYDPEIEEVGLYTLNASGSIEETYWKANLTDGKYATTINNLIVTDDVSLTSAVVSHSLSADTLVGTSAVASSGSLSSMSLSVAGPANISGDTTIYGDIVASGTKFSFMEKTPELLQGDLSAYLVTASGADYYIGIGSLGTNNQGIKVTMAPDFPTMPVNLRISDISPSDSTSVKESKVTFKWNFENIVGAQGSDNNIDGVNYPTFELNTTDGDTPNVSNGDMKNKYLQFSSGVKYKIYEWDNTNNILTLSISYDSDGQSSTVGSPAKIVDLGSGYTLKIFKYIDDNTKVLEKHLTLQTEEISSLTTATTLPLDKSYYVEMNTINGDQISSVHDLSSGSFDPDSLVGSGQSVINYSSPFHNSLPLLENLPTVGDHLQLDATTFGFIATINGWGEGETDTDKKAHAFEIGYTVQGAFSWDAATTTKITSVNRVNPISNIYDSDSYTVAVRPIQNDTVVSDAVVQKQILAGGGGVPPNMQVVVDHSFSLVTYSGTYTGQNSSGGTTTLSGVNFDNTGLGTPVIAPNELGVTTPGVPGTLSSSQLSSHTVIYNGSFNSSSDDSSDITVVVDGESGTTFSDQSTEFTVNTTEEGRKILETQLNADFTLKKIVVDVDYASGVSGASPGILRVYPKGNTSAGDKIQITASGSNLFSQVIDLPINTNVEANRTIIIDGWDDSTPSNQANNTWSMNGTVFIYGQTYESNINQFTDTSLN